MLRRFTGTLSRTTNRSLFNRPFASFSNTEDPNVKMKLKLQQAKKELEEKAEQQRDEEMIEIMNNPERKKRIVHLTLLIVLLAGTGLHTLKRWEARQIRLQQEPTDLAMDPNKELKEVVLKYSK